MFDRYITLRAQLTPHAVALSMPAGEVSFVELDLAVGRVASALGSVLGCALAAVMATDPYIHWLVVLALARMGIASVSVAPEQEEAQLALAAIDLVISDSAAPKQWQPNGRRWIQISHDWVASALRRTEPPPPRALVDPDALGRIVTSSGSTCTPKMIPLTWRTIETRVMHNALKHGAAPDLGRTISLINTGAVGFVFSITTWAAGGTLILTSRDSNILGPALAKLRPSTLLLSPIQLRFLLEALPRGFQLLRDLRLLVTGSVASQALRVAAQLRLAPSFEIVYGAAEVGIVSQGNAATLGDDPTACGWVLPWYDVSVTDDDGGPCLPGEAGHIWVRGPAVVAGYYGSPAEGKAQFHDGWYRSGDVGRLSAEGALRVEGRADDRMNFGGVKMLPGPIEEAALSCPGIKDAAAFAVPDSAGFDQPWLALVRDHSDDAALDAALRTRVPGLPIIRIASVDAIPRNAGGKIDRRRLRDAAAASGTA